MATDPSAAPGPRSLGLLATRRIVVELVLEAPSLRLLDEAHRAITEKLRRALPAHTVRPGHGGPSVRVLRAEAKQIPSPLTHQVSASQIELRKEEGRE